MKTVSTNGVTAVVDQKPVVIPDLTIKQLLDSVPPHCFKRSAIKSTYYIFQDLACIAACYKLTRLAQPYLTPEHISLPSPWLYTAANIALWSTYGFFAGTWACGLWVIGHECGHQSFSEYKNLNNFVGWVLHSSLGAPYHSWRITHAKHHASTGHMTLDENYVPWTRSQLGLPALDPSKETLEGDHIHHDVQSQLREALGDSPIVGAWNTFAYLLFGFPNYLLFNAFGQVHLYGDPPVASHFNPWGKFFAPHQATQIIISDLGVVAWAAAVIYYSLQVGFLEVFRVYLVPYLWVNHWLILFTYLHHTDPMLPHYRASEYSFARGALTTFNRNLMGDMGPFFTWLGAFSMHGIAETHVAHHVSSRIPHYNAWEASDAICNLAAKHGMSLYGGPCSWAEMYRNWRACRFVEDEGEVIFYKDANGLARARPAKKEEIPALAESDKQK
ncbi:delta-12 fatty acid desaturase protein [Gloeopeniophorella convolvens]|nr:delta-12 fatty acid desaturase protein [Gloeopeniophorella convolvens]